jgi:hypothetical protein
MRRNYNLLEVYMESQITSANNKQEVLPSLEGENSIISESLEVPRYVNAIREATEFLPKMDIPKMTNEDGFFAIESKVRQLKDEDDGIKNISKVLFVAGTRVGVSGKDLFSYLQFVPDLISKMPSTLEQEAQDKAIIKKSDDLKASMNLIIRCFGYLKKDLDKELIALGSKPAFNSLKDCLEGYSGFYKKNSHYITKASNLYDDLVEKATERMKEDCDRKEIVEKKTEYATISKIFKMKLEDFQKIVIQYHKNTEIIEKVPEDLKVLKGLMDTAVHRYRVKFNFFAEHCAQRFYPDDSWAYAAYRKKYYASVATFSSFSYFSPNSYIDNSLRFDRDDYLLPLNSNDLSGENYLAKSEDIDFNNLQQKLKRSTNKDSDSDNNSSESVEEDLVGYLTSTRPVQIPSKSSTPDITPVLSVNVGRPDEFFIGGYSQIQEEGEFFEILENSLSEVAKKEELSNLDTTELIPVLEFTENQDEKK